MFVAKFFLGAAITAIVLSMASSLGPVPFIVETAICTLGFALGAVGLAVVGANQPTDREGKQWLGAAAVVSLVAAAHSVMTLVVLSGEQQPILRSWHLASYPGWLQPAVNVLCIVGVTPLALLTIGMVVMLPIMGVQSVMRLIGKLRAHMSGKPPLRVAIEVGAGAVTLVSGAAFTVAIGLTVLVAAVVYIFAVVIIGMIVVAMAGAALK